jgi:copper chaperone
MATVIQVTVPSMACAACADTITKAIHGIDANAQVKADPATKDVSITTTAAADAICAAIDAAGYPVQSQA